MTPNEHLTVWAELTDSRRQKDSNTDKTISNTITNNNLFPFTTSSDVVLWL